MLIFFKFQNLKLIFISVNENYENLNTRYEKETLYQIPSFSLFKRKFTFVNNKSNEKKFGIHIMVPIFCMHKN